MVVTQHCQERIVHYQYDYEPHLHRRYFFPRRSDISGWMSDLQTRRNLRNRMGWYSLLHVPQGFGRRKRNAGRCSASTGNNENDPPTNCRGYGLQALIGEAVWVGSVLHTLRRSNRAAYFIFSIVANWCFPAVPGLRRIGGKAGLCGFFNLN